MRLERSSAGALLLGSTLGTVVAALAGSLDLIGLLIWIFFFVLFLISKPDSLEKK